MVMDFVKGRTVEECWDDLSQAERVDVVSQVASMITALHSITLSQEQQQQQPGPVGCKTSVARGYWFPDAGAGPFGSKEQLQAWFNRRLEITQHFNQAPKDADPFQFDRLVLRHHDIAPRNLILGPDGKVCLIDWADSGIYPEGFEFAALHSRRSAAPEFTDMLLEMLPRYEKVAKQLRRIMYALTTAQWVDWIDRS
jgi:aminoglycoside phosphotransferase (APT) family kinase protein